MKWLADRFAARRPASPEERVKFGERGILLASGFVAGEAIMAVVLAALFPKGGSLTHFVTGRDELPFLAPWGGWLSLAAFAAIGYCLIQIPLRKRT